MTSADNAVAVVLGATGAIGSCLLETLHHHQYQVIGVARTSDRLQEITAQLDPDGTTATPLAIDLRDVSAAETIRTHSIQVFGKRPQVIVQAGGVFSLGTLVDTDPQLASQIMETNALAAHRLIAELMSDPLILHGHVVIINSTAGLAFNPSAAVYSLSQILSRSLTDALRDKLNPQDIRVTSIFPGRTLGPLQAKLLASEGRPVLEDHLLAPSDVAQAMMTALKTSDRAEITEITLRPMRPYPST